MIHATAIIHPNAKLDPSVDVGPYAVVDEHVTIGAGCRLGPHVYITGHTQVGSENQFFAGSVIGEAPQDLKYHGQPTRLIIGNQNVFREQVTVHRSNKIEEDTIVGNNNYLMANCHVGHNVRLGNQIIIANAALLGGHASVDDGAFVSGSCLVHQFVRIGALALMQGGAAISLDLPPFTIATGPNAICGLNVVGLRRAGISSERRQEIKRLYHFLFRGKHSLPVALSLARDQFKSPESLTVINFIVSSKRGVVRDVKGARNSQEEL